MEFDITDQIEKTINATIKGPRGVQIANIYHKYSNIINFCIVYGIGIFLYTTLQNLNFFLAIIVALLWTYVMTIGPLGHIWGFKTSKQTPPPVPPKPKSPWKKGEKKTIVQYREAKSNVEKIDTPEGPKYAEQDKDYVMLDPSGKEVSIKKEELEATYAPVEGDEKT